MNVYTKQKQSYRDRKQTCGYQRGEGREEGQIRGMRLTDTNYYSRWATRVYYIAQGIIPIIL